MTRVPRSIALRFLLTLLPAIALLLLGFGWWVVDGLESSVEYEVEKVLMPQQRAAATKDVRELLFSLQQTCWQVARDPAARVFRATNDLPARIERFKETLGKDPRYQRDLSLVVLTDRNGKVITYAPLGETAAIALRSPLPVDEVTQVGDEPWFEALKSENENSHWGDRERSKYLHREPNAPSKDPSDWSIPFAMYVVDATTYGTVGAIYCLLPWTRVQEILDSSAAALRDDARYRSAHAGLCDAAGVFLAHTDRERYGQWVEPELRAAMGAEAKGLRDDGQIVSAWQKTDLPQPWSVVVQVAHKDLYTPVAEFRRRLWLTILAAVVVSGAWALRAARQVLVPVQRLAQAAVAIAKGDFSVRVRERGRDELDDLARAFNQMARDVEQSRSKLAKAEREAAWAEMARQVAHEIKNPLTPMRMSAQMLIRARREGDARQDELVDRLARTVIEQTDTLSRIANDFRQFAGRGDRQRAPVTIDDVLASARRLFLGIAEERKMALDVAPGAAGAQVLGDAQDLQRVLHNLLLNAFEACPVGGRVELASRLEGGRVVVTVTDDGPGVPDEVKGRLFEPNFTTKSSGTGLGLAICRKIVEEHNGTIALERSEPGSTVFRIDLPVV